MRSQRSYLLIPHAPATRLKTRADELARGLAGLGHRVEILRRRGRSGALSLPGKIGWHLGELLGGMRTEALAENISLLFPPTLHHASPVQRKFDQLVSHFLARRENDFVVSSAFGGPSFSPLRTGTRRVYDYVDDHANGWRHAGEHRLARRVEYFMAREIGRADRVIASSRFQVDEVRAKFGRDAMYVPNGADVEAIRRVPANRAHAGVRILYMGGLDYFVNLSWPLSAVERLRAKGIEAELWIVGEGPVVRDRAFPQWVKLLGFRQPTEIPGILAQVNVGIVPFVLNPFTDAALPLKVLEYGAAGLPTVSSPLSELKIQRFPWVQLAEPDEESWFRALATACERRWDRNWDQVVDEFDWRRIAGNLDALLQDEGGARGNRT